MAGDQPGTRTNRGPTGDTALQVMAVGLGLDRETTLGVEQLDRFRIAKGIKRPWSDKRSARTI